MTRAFMPSTAGKQDSWRPAFARAIAGAGRSLDARIAGEAASSFGADFSRVRVHDGADASLATRAAGANAMAFGEHLVFAPGRYDPQSSRGRELIAHELAHVAQQRAGPGHAPGHLSHPADAGERAAEAGARAFGAGRAAAALGNTATGVVSRSCSDGRCDTCNGGRQDLWVTVYFRRRATQRTMSRLRNEINAAKTLLSNCCIDIKFDFDWRLLRGPSRMSAPTARPAGDPNGALDYSDDVTQLGEGTTFDNARGVPMVVVDEVPGSGGGMTVTPLADQDYAGRTYMVWGLTESRRSDNTIAHELWHVAGNLNHNASAGSLVETSGNRVSDAYCTSVRTLL